MCVCAIILQVMGLSGRVRAYALTSLTSKEEAAEVMAALTAAAAGGSKATVAKGRGKGSSSSAGAAAAAAAGGGGGSEPLLLYVTPEKIVASKRLMAKLEKLHQVGLLDMSCCLCNSLVMESLHTQIAGAIVSEAVSCKLEQMQYLLKSSSHTGKCSSGQF